MLVRRENFNRRAVVEFVESLRGEGGRLRGMSARRKSSAVACSTVWPVRKPPASSPPCIRRDQCARGLESFAGPQPSPHRARTSDEFDDGGAMKFAPDQHCLRGFFLPCCSRHWHDSGLVYLPPDCLCGCGPVHGQVIGILKSILRRIRHRIRRRRILLRRNKVNPIQ